MQLIFSLAPLDLNLYTEPGQNETPNIIVIFCDDMGYGDLACYGHPTIRTPNLDKMASQGIRFTNFYSGSPACTASRYALLTGRYPLRSGFPWVLYPKSEKGIHPNEITIAEELKGAGYATAAFGKWHLGTNQNAFLPLQNGFDEYIGLPYSNDMLPPRWQPIALLNGNDTLEMSPDQSKLTKLYSDQAIEFIERKKNQPFFVYIPYAMPHLPLHPGKDFEGKSVRGIYGDVIEEIDWNVGRILEYLKEKNLDKNTLVFFTSDNGPWIIKNQEGGSAGLLRDGKGSTWEGGMREPAIAWWPGRIEQGVNYLPHSTIDLLPTILDLADISLPGDRTLDGRSFAHELFNISKSETQPEPFFYHGPQLVHAVRLGPWKLHVHTSSQTQNDYFDGELPLLFNLDADPSEKYNLAKDQPKKVRQLTRLIEKHSRQLIEEGSFYQSQ